MHWLLNLLLRGVLLAAGLVFALSLALVVAIVLGAWCVRAAWYRLTGRPVTPFVMQMGPRRAFEEMMRRAPAASPARPHRTLGDVTDVEPK